MAKDTTTMVEVLGALLTLAETAFAEGYAAGFAEGFAEPTTAPQHRHGRTAAWDASETNCSLDEFKRFLTATVQP